MPVNFRHYHPDWKDVIRPRILKRDNYRCKICGVPNKSRIVRDSNDQWLEVDDLIERESVRTGTKIIRVILTVAHLNHIVTDNRDENLASLCQLHHIRHDQKHKAAMRKVAKVWNPADVVRMVREVDGAQYLNHLFVLARARRNQIRQLLDIKRRRSGYGGYSKYDKDLLQLLKKSRSEYFSLIKAGCEVLSSAYGIKDPDQFFRDYWSADSTWIGGSHSESKNQNIQNER